MAKGFGMNCIKYLVFIFNFLFAVSISLPDRHHPDKLLLSLVQPLTLQDSTLNSF